MMINLKDKIALVTGASRGIGKGIAINLAKNGAYVFGTATNKNGVDVINNLFAEEKLQGCGIMLDVTHEVEVANFIKDLTEQGKMPAILVNNAGVTADNLLLKMTDSEWSKVIDTNLNAIFRLCRACIKTMFRARWGRIINIGSIVGSTGNAGQVNYCAAKAGVVGFTKALAQEIASRNITVNVVAPGFIGTDMTNSLPEVIQEAILKKIPMKRLGKVEDIAAVVSFLASDSASYITGETIHVNGGMYMH